MDDKDLKTEIADDEVNDEMTETAEEQGSRPVRARHFDDKDQRLKEKNSKKLEKMLKKQRRKAGSSDPEALSDEKMPPEEPIEVHTAAKKNYPLKRIITAAAIVALVFTVVLYALNTDKLTWHNISNFIQYGIFNSRSDESFPLDVKGVSVSPGNFQRMGQDICYSSDTKTQLLNNYGRSEFTRQHAFINPVLAVGEEGALVFNLGGTGYQIINKEGSAYSGTAQDNILLADYGDDGCYALVTESSGYHSKLYVYNEEHKQIFAYSFADYYITSVSLDSSGRHAVLSGVSALDGVELSCIYVLDFTKETPLHFSELENNIIYRVEYLSDKYACAVGRSAAYTINTDSGEIETNDYKGKELTAFDINTDTDTYTLSLSGSGDGRNCTIATYSTGGSKVRSFDIDAKIIDVSSYKGRVALLTGEKVMLYSKDGRSVSEEELDSDPHKVVLYTTSDAYILCTGYINVVSL